MVKYIFEHDNICRTITQLIKGDQDNIVIEGEKWPNGSQYTVTRSNFLTLRPDEWLNDNKKWLSDKVISYFFNYLQTRDKGLKSKMRFCNTYFYQALEGYITQNPDDRIDKIEGLRTQQLGGSLFNYSKIFVPVNIRTVHWVLFEINTVNRIVTCYDSMLSTVSDGIIPTSDEDGEEVFETLQKFINTDQGFNTDPNKEPVNFQLINASKSHPPQQNNGKFLATYHIWNGLSSSFVSRSHCYTYVIYDLIPDYDCGVMMCLFAELLSKGKGIKGLQTTSAYQDMYRLYIAHILNTTSESVSKNKKHKRGQTYEKNEEVFSPNQRNRASSEGRKKSKIEVETVNSYKDFSFTSESGGNNKEQIVMFPSKEFNVKKEAKSGHPLLGALGIQTKENHTKAALVSPEVCNGESKGRKKSKSRIWQFFR